MTYRPYTDDDLRAEAARQHAELIDESLEYAGVGEAMADRRIGSAGVALWGDLDGDAFGYAQEQIHALIRGAAGVYEWAINLGADGLQPDEHTIQLGEDPGDGDRPRVRMHFAFHPDMPDADRDHFVMALSKVVLRNL